MNLLQRLERLEREAVAVAPSPVRVFIHSMGEGSEDWTWAADSSCLTERDYLRRDPGETPEAFGARAMQYFPKGPSIHGE